MRAPRMSTRTLICVRRSGTSPQVAVAAYYYLDLPIDDVAAIMACSPAR